MQWILAYLLAFLDVWLEAAPWLLVGLLAAGLIQVFVPTDRMAGWLGGSGVWASLKAAVIGTPLPLCSCSVLPAALAIRKQGASKPSTVSFLVATPENGADSIALTWALLGPWFAITRPIAAIISAVVAGTLTAATTRDQDDEALEDETSGPDPSNTENPHSAGSCCGTSTATSSPTPCCSTSTGSTYYSQAISLPQKLKSAVGFGFGPMLKDIAKWLMVGLLLAALMNTLIDPGTLAQYGSGPIAYAVMIGIGVPMYICATTSTPVAASLLLAGVSPGAVLIFLLVGPATNLGSIAIVRNALGTRSLLSYLLGVILTALAAAILVDTFGWLASNTEASSHTKHQHASHMNPISIFAGAILAIAIARQLIVKFHKSATSSDT